MRQALRINQFHPLQFHRPTSLLLLTRKVSNGVTLSLFFLLSMQVNRNNLSHIILPQAIACLRASSFVQGSTRSDRTLSSERISGISWIPDLLRFLSVPVEMRHSLDKDRVNINPDSRIAAGSRLLP